HHGRQVVHIAHEGPLDSLRCVGLAARCARLEQLVLVLERAARFDLVVAEQGPEPLVCPETGQQVAALLEDQHGMPGFSQHPGGPYIASSVFENAAPTSSCTAESDWSERIRS